MAIFQLTSGHEEPEDGIHEFCLILVRSVSVPVCILSDLAFSERRIPSCGSSGIFKPAFVSPFIQLD